MIRPPLAARRALVIAPHPDDEAIGAWALMQRLRRNGAAVELIVVSDGAASHPESRSWPRARLVAERRRETLRAMARLSVAPSQVRFLALPDGQLADDPGRLDRGIARALRRRRMPDLLVGPVGNDAHPDHCAVAAALARARRRGERRLGYRVWPEGGNGRRSVFRIALDGAGLRIKRCVIRSYRTQTGMITDAQAGFTMTPRHLLAFTRPSERFELLA